MWSRSGVNEAVFYGADEFSSFFPPRNFSGAALGRIARLTLTLTLWNLEVTSRSIFAGFFSLPFNMLRLRIFISWNATMHSRCWNVCDERKIVVSAITLNYVLKGIRAFRLTIRVIPRSKEEYLAFKQLFILSYVIFVERVPISKERGHSVVSFKFFCRSSQNLYIQGGW